MKRALDAMFLTEASQAVVVVACLGEERLAAPADVFGVQVRANCNM